MNPFELFWTILDYLHGGKFKNLPFFLGGVSPGLSHFREWPVQDSVFSGVWQIGIFWGGKKEG